MTVNTANEAVVTAQKAWAERQGLAPDERGYLTEAGANLRAPLSAAAQTAFEAGNGSELSDRDATPAKMRALHSSSALAVNVFDFWAGRDLGRVLRALRVDGRGTGLEFERKLPTGARGIPPNLDVVITLDDGRLVGVESKFTEWMSPKRNMEDSLAPYIEPDRSRWSEAGLTRCDRLARAMQAGTVRFHHLDVPQLLKHALGLANAPVPGWQLRYVYFDAPGVGATHARELALFANEVGQELGFDAVSYQTLIATLGPAQDADESAYLGYLTERYLQGGPAT